MKKLVLLTVLLAGCAKEDKGGTIVEKVVVPEHRIEVLGDGTPEFKPYYLYPPERYGFVYRRPGSWCDDWAWVNKTTYDSAKVGDWFEPSEDSKDNRQSKKEMKP